MADLAMPAGTPAITPSADADALFAETYTAYRGFVRTAAMGGAR